MKKSLKFTFLAILFLFILIPNHTFASSLFQSIDINSLDFNSINKSKVQDLKDTIENLGIDENVISNSLTSNNIDQSTVNTIIDAYEELSNVVSNDEIANFIEDNKDVLATTDTSKAALSASSVLLKNFDADTVIDIVQNDLNVDELLEVSKNSSPEQIVSNVLQSTTTLEKINIFFKLLFSNNYFKLLFALLVVVFIYSILITGIIFKKAGCSGLLTLIPIVRYAISLKLYNFSPWLILLLFVPVIGWLALIAISIVRKI